MEHGFKLLEKREIPEIHCQALVYEHQATGGRLLSLIAPDENKVFGISFRTPPHDSTGLPHILEHSVLCGSEKYPVKEPFVELLKSSLQTFLNALTFPDKTCYPVASANERDFRNLVDVYLDAVFFPRLTPQVLMQEGWHYEMGEDQRLSYQGVVFGEMKGAYSSPDSLLMEASQQSLFPDTPYGLDSGGDPERIPDLTFEDFQAFHQRHYHPSNAWAFFYGDDDPEERLKALDGYFSRFSRLDEAVVAGSAVPEQDPFSEPVAVTRAYACSPGETKGQATVNFCLGATKDPDLNLEMQALEHILIGLPSSRLRKALTDSGLGEDLAGLGLEADLLQLYFSVGLKGMDPTQAAAMEKLVMDCLVDMAQSIRPDEIEAALNTLEFDLRENNTGSYPRGLSLMFHALTSWLHGGDPLALIAFEDRLKRLRTRLDKGEQVFEDLIRERFLGNPHRSRVTLKPDPDLAQATANKERARLDAALKAMSPEEKAEVRKQAKELKKAQEAPDDPEALATIPRLVPADLPRVNQRIPMEVYERGESKTLFHEQPTNGLVYVDLGFDLRRLPDELLPYAPVFGRALKEMGTATEDYAAFLNRIARKTGGIDPAAMALAVRDTGACASKLFLRGKAVQENAEELIAILTDMVFTAKFEDKERFQRIVTQAKARAEQRIIPSGHMAVLSRLRALDPNGYTHPAHRDGELLSGVSQLFFLRELARRVDQDFDRVCADLHQIRSMLLCADAVVINVTAEEEGFSSLLPGLSEFHRSMPLSCSPPQDRGALDYVPAQGLSIPAQINYVGKGVSLDRLGLDPGLASAAVIKQLRTGYLWDRVRVQGGAYGAFCVYDRLAGHLAMVSYRDPNLDRTLETFDKAAAHLAKFRPSSDDLEKACVGAIGEMDTYLLPDAKGFTSLIRQITGEDEDYRQAMREALLSVGPKDFKQFAEAARALAKEGNVVVLGPETALKESKLEFDTIKVL